MSRSNREPGDVRWGWDCPRCDRATRVRRDPSTGTYRWECPDETCPAVGFGFISRRRARLALREFRKREENVYR
ncbi:hypothetical protein ACFO5R_19920 [Halosolutus amylolyticus]|uniref:Uncharacterized protein n=1 Tax=Halosolutus amylolyticus TaxID=2932267 RepID=A0ABD5PUJ2_9EURY|nr:hypothetical protein [Halosolutus amylolyticus]